MSSSYQRTYHHGLLHKLCRISRDVPGRESRNFRKFWNFGNFWKFRKVILTKWQKMLTIFFVIFIQDNAFFILVEFESDQMSPRESTENGRIGAYGLKCKFFMNSELIFEIYDKISSRKKISCLYDTFEIYKNY